MVASDRVDYAVPGGRLVNRLLVARDLRRIFSYRGDRLRRALRTWLRGVSAGRRPRARGVGAGSSPARRSGAGACHPQAAQAVSAPRRPRSAAPAAPGRRSRPAPGNRGRCACRSASSAARIRGRSRRPSHRPRARRSSRSPIIRHCAASTSWYSRLTSILFLPELDGARLHGAHTRSGPPAAARVEALP